MSYLAAFFWFVVIVLILVADFYGLMYGYKGIKFLRKKLSRKNAKSSSEKSSEESSKNAPVSEESQVSSKYPALERRKAAVSEKTEKAIAPNPFQRFFQQNTFLVFLMVSIAFNVSMLVNVNDRYLFEESAYPKARPLFYVGNLANGYSKFFSKSFGAPDRWYLAPIHEPMVWIKRAVYAQTMEHIAREDPERELLRYEWEYYPYVALRAEYRGYFNRKDTDLPGYSECCNPKFAGMLEDLWFIMERVHDGAFADKNREVDGLMSFPAMGNYFFVNLTELLPPEHWKDKGLFLSTNPTMVGRNDKLIVWFDEEYDQRIAANPKAAEATKNNPSITAIRDLLMLYVMEVGVTDLIFKRTFACEHPQIARYAVLRNRYFSSDNPTFQAMKKQGKHKLVNEYLYSAKETSIAAYMKQFFREYCLIDLPGVASEDRPGGFYDMLTVRLSYLITGDRKIVENELGITRKVPLTARQRFYVEQKEEAKKQAEETQRKSEERAKEFEVYWKERNAKEASQKANGGRSY